MSKVARNEHFAKHQGGAALGKSCSGFTFNSLTQSILADHHRVLMAILLKLSTGMIDANFSLVCKSFQDQGPKKARLFFPDSDLIGGTT